MINLVEKEFFKVAKAELDKFVKSADGDLPQIRVMRVGSSHRYSIYLISKDLRISLSSSRKESRTFAKVETAAALIRSYGIRSFTVVDLSCG
jgi:hypothetical protein